MSNREELTVVSHHSLVILQGVEVCERRWKPKVGPKGSPKGRSRQHWGDAPLTRGKECKSLGLGQADSQSSQSGPTESSATTDLSADSGGHAASSSA